MTHTSPNYKCTVDYHSEEGQAIIHDLRQEVKRHNQRSRRKLRVNLCGRGPRQAIAGELGLPYDALYHRHPPLHLATRVDVYVCPARW